MRIKMDNPLNIRTVPTVTCNPRAKNTMGNEPSSVESMYAKVYSVREGTFFIEQLNKLEQIGMENLIFKVPGKNSGPLERCLMCVVDNPPLHLVIVFCQAPKILPVAVSC